MPAQETALEALIRELGVTHCPACQTQITPATVKVDWTYRPQDYPFGPLAWLVCRVSVDKGFGQSLCAHFLKRRDIPPDRVVRTPEEAIAVLRGV
jgi:hypothetical protein